MKEQKAYTVCIGIFLSLLVNTLAFLDNETPRPTPFDPSPPGFSPKVTSTASTEDGQESWGFVDVRPDAHMFYWLYYTTHQDGWKDRPLVLWLQGGPGGSSTGYGNFEIIGPLDLNLNERNTTWVQSANILFTDNPVGAGYSYVDNNLAFTRDLEEVSSDMSAFFKAFMAEYPDFETTPMYIFGQSYGGKMAAGIAQRLQRDIDAGELKMDLRGFAMGNAWTSPLDSTLTWGEFLYWMSTVDEQGMEEINATANLALQAAIDGQWVQSTQYWRQTQQAVFRHSNYVDFYNILNFLTFDYYATHRAKKPNNPFGDKYDLIFGPMEDDPLYVLMNGPIREKLGDVIPEDVIWDGQSDLVFFFQEGDFMKHVLTEIDDILNNTNQHVITYQGQLDLICDTQGAHDWVQRLQWSGIPNYNTATRYPLTEPTTGQTDTFVKAYENFKFYWMLRAGHAVPADMPEAGLRMLNRVLDDVDR